MRSSFGLKRTPHLLLTQVTQIGRCGVLNLEPNLCFWVFSEVLSHIRNPIAFLAAMPISSRSASFSVTVTPLWRNGVADPVSNKFERQSDIFKEIHMIVLSDLFKKVTWSWCLGPRSGFLLIFCISDKSLA